MAIERRRIGLREVAALAPNQEVWDSAVAGFGARRQRSKSIAYVVLYRTRDGRPRRYTIGRHGAPWTPETARIEAKRILGLVADGADPAGDKRRQRSQVTTVAELCDEYLQEAEAGRLLTRRRAGKKPSTLMTIAAEWFATSSRCSASCWLPLLREMTLSASCTRWLKVSRRSASRQRPEVSRMFAVAAAPQPALWAFSAQSSAMPCDRAFAWIIPCTA